MQNSNDMLKAWKVELEELDLQRAALAGRIVALEEKEKRGRVEALEAEYSNCAWRGPNGDWWRRVRRFYESGGTIFYTICDLSIANGVRQIRTTRGDFSFTIDGILPAVHGMDRIPLSEFNAKTQTLMAQLDDDFRK